MENNYWSKTIRTITSILPVEKSRKGSCKSCRECCKLPDRCVFLDYDDENKSSCKAYSFRPLNCRKYPRSANEHITPEKCGFYFEDEKIKVN